MAWTRTIPSLSGFAAVSTAGARRASPPFSLAGFEAGGRGFPPAGGIAFARSAASWRTVWSCERPCATAISPAVESRRSRRKRSNSRGSALRFCSRISSSNSSPACICSAIPSRLTDAAAPFKVWNCRNRIRRGAGFPGSSSSVSRACSAACIAASASSAKASSISASISWARDSLSSGNSTEAGSQSGAGGPPALAGPDFSSSRGCCASSALPSPSPAASLASCQASSGNPSPASRNRESRPGCTLAKNAGARGSSGPSSSSPSKAPWSSRPIFSSSSQPTVAALPLTVWKTRPSSLQVSSWRAGSTRSATSAGSPASRSPSSSTKVARSSAARAASKSSSSFGTGRFPAGFGSMMPPPVRPFAPLRSRGPAGNGRARGGHRCGCA